MGNIPLCVPKRGGPVVFTEGYHHSMHAGSRHLPMKPYHPYQSSLEDLLSPALNPQNSDENTNVYTDENKRQSILVGEDTAIVGLELEQDSDQVYSGLLQFQYFSGSTTDTKNIHVRSTDTAGDLITELTRVFLFQSEEHLDTNSEHKDEHHSYIALVQGEMERELDVMEKPLQIALDCSSKGLASPKFIFKSPLPEQTDTPSTPHHTNRFTSYLGSLALPSGCSEHENSPLVTRHLSKTLNREFDQASMNSFGSALSLSSSKSNKSKSTSSLVFKSKKKKLSHTLSNQETGGPSLSERSANSSPAHHRSQVQINDSPSSNRKQRRPKSVVTKFITRSLRVRKKKPTGNPPSESPEEVDGSLLPDTDDEVLPINGFLSPLPMERRFTLSAVMHIYYMKPQQIQLYKSVLVSEKATTGEVISQALERYNMKLCSPDDFGLYEVIGKWQDITSTLPANISFQASTSVNGATASLPGGMGLHNTSPLVQRRTAVEEFVVCHSRELDPKECPYNVQFFLATKEGYTRRFELRSKSTSNLTVEEEKFRKQSTASVSALDGHIPSPVVTNRSASVAQINHTPEASPCIFGQTSNRKRARRNRIANLSPTANNETPAENEDITVKFSLTEEQDEKGSRDTEQRDITDSENRNSPENEIKILDSGNDSAINMKLHTPPDSPCFSPDCGPEMCKDPRQGTKIPTESHHNSDHDVSTPRKGNTRYMADLNTPFILSLRVFDPKREPLVHLLTRDTTRFASSITSDPKSGSRKQGSTKTTISPNLEESDNDSVIILCNPDLNETTSLCSICRQPLIDSKTNRPSNCSYSIQTVHDSKCVLLNGKSVEGSTPLKHGDILVIGGLYMFIFQDYSSLGNDPSPNYNWEPCPLDSLTIKPINHNLSRIPGTTSRPERLHKTSLDSQTSVKLKLVSERETHSRSGSEISLTVEDFESHTIKSIDLSTLHIHESHCRAQDKHHHTDKSQDEVFPEGIGHNTHSRLIMRQVFQTESKDADDDELVLSMPSNSEMFNPDGSATVPLFSPHLSTKKQLKQTASLPSHSLPRKMMFSFSLNEEDPLLELLINRFDHTATKCNLAPSYILSMCVEYGMMCYGPRAMKIFVKKSISHIQTAAWDSCKNLTEWQINTESARKPLSILKELFSALEPVLLWLANALEFYHFLSNNCETLNLTEPNSPQQNGHLHDAEQDDGTEDTLTILYNVLVYTFQQAFYSVSRVLYHSLPVMLDGCTEDKLMSGNNQPIVVDQAVEFLQALLDLLTGLHIHLEVVSQFYTNVFFFTNAVMFNALIDQGGDFALYQNTSGKALRANLNLLEGWACQVGFRDNVLHYLAKFSGAVDLLATPPQQLLQMDWSMLRREFPVLHPAQLHYILSQYLLPSSVVQVPDHWTPTRADAIHAVKTSALEESFDHHPLFELPSTGYTLDLTKPPLEEDQFQSFIDRLRKRLKNPKRKESIEIVPVAENRHTFATNDTSNTSRHVRTNQEIKPHKVRTHLINSSQIRARRNIGSNTESQEDLLEDTRNNNKNSKHITSERLKYEELEDTVITGNPHSSYSEKPSSSSKIRIRGSGRDQVVERVHSMITPRSFKTPEKFLLEPDEADTSNQSWLESHFPPNAETVTIPRGDKGFGLIMVEAKDPGTSDTAIFIQGVIPGSTAEKCAQLNTGDKILAIDGQLLDGADYIIADKYLREAEEDVSLVVLPSQRTNTM